MCPSFEEYQKLFTPTYTGDLWRGARGESKSGTCFARKATKPLPCLHFTFIQPALINAHS